MVPRSPHRSIACGLLLIAFYLLLALPANAQRPGQIAILTPEKNPLSSRLAEKLGQTLSPGLKISDSSLSATAFDSFGHENPFNLSLREARDTGLAIGCDYFILIRAATQPRFSLEKKGFIEAYAAVFVVSSRTGRLIFWKLVRGEDKEEEKAAENRLLNSVGELGEEIIPAINETTQKEVNEENAPRLEELPEENSPRAEGFRPPLPYRRIRPQYTDLADLYSIEATVDILLDVDETGRILRTEISRWAGYGLDEAVTRAVLEMNWRPASRNEKTLPIRVLLRYNFKDID